MENVEKSAEHIEATGIHQGQWFKDKFGAIRTITSVEECVNYERSDAYHGMGFRVSKGEWNRMRSEFSIGGAK